jgi:hypothetical protein
MRAQPNRPMTIERDRTFTPESREVVNDAACYKYFHGYGVPRLVSTAGESPVGRWHSRADTSGAAKAREALVVHRAGFSADDECASCVRGLSIRPPARAGASRGCCTLETLAVEQRDAQGGCPRRRAGRPGRGTNSVSSAD